MEIKKVGVLGCGLMGSGIAQVCATAGFDVTVLEVEQKFLDKGFAGIEKSLAKFAERPVEKGGITAQQKDAIRARLKGTTNKSDLADCDIVVEAIIENVDEKKKMYASIDSVVKKNAIFASNTSSISVTELLTSVKRPERFVGLHFFNPVPLMKLVEVVRTIATARLLMPASMVRLSAGRRSLTREATALCFLAGANSIFVGEKLLTTPNPERDEDAQLFRDLGLRALSHGQIAS